MNSLSLRETLRHLDLLIASAPQLEDVFSNANEAANFVTLCNRLRSLLKEKETTELSVDLLWKTLFPKAATSSRRVLFSKFRKTLSLAAEAKERDFSLIQPNLKGKDLTEVYCHFEGSAVSREPELDRATLNATAERPGQPLVQAQIAALTGKKLAELTSLFHDTDSRDRIKVRFFLSYAHKNDARVTKLLDSLRDELAISKRFAFSIWQDKRLLVGQEWHQNIQKALQECDLCLPLLSPAFFASNYITTEELPPVASGEIPSVPVMLEPLDFARCDLHGLEQRQIFRLEENNHSRAFSETSGTVSQRFNHELAKKIEESTTHALELRTLALLSNTSEIEELKERVPEVAELLRSSLPTKKSEQSPSPEKNESRRENINRLLRNLPETLDRNLVDACIATGSLDAITRQVVKNEASRNEEDDPYSAFEMHRQEAVSFLRGWIDDPDSPPFAAVLGEIGSGKTTMLQMLATSLARDPSAPPVIYIDLRDHSKTTEVTLEELLAEHLRRNDREKSLQVDDLIHAVRHENALIIFDGLDERILALSQNAARNFVKELWRILPPDYLDRSVAEGRGRLIFSCRSHYFTDIHAQSSGYLDQDRSSITARDYLACVMLPWNEEQVKEYLSKTLGAEHLVEALENIANTHNLTDLSRRPFLLRLIAPELESLERDRAAGRVINAASLYKKFITRWLNRDEQKQIFTPPHKIQMMEKIATDLWREGSREWPWEEVEAWLDQFLETHSALTRNYTEFPAAALKQDFRTATLVLRPDACSESFRFAHTSLQEYFLASAMVKILLAGKADAAEGWNLPMPSLETFDFLGQILLSQNQRNRDKALASLAEILGNDSSPALSRLAAFRYQLWAHEKNLPIPQAPDLAFAGLDLSAWKIHGTPTRPLLFGKCDFSNSKLVESSFEYVTLAPESNFEGADLRGAQLNELLAPESNFENTLTRCSFFRNKKTPLSTTLPPPAPALLHSSFSTPSSLPTHPLSLLLSQGHSNAVASVAFSPDGQFILSGSGDRTLKLWDAQSGQCLRSFNGHSLGVASAAFSPDGKFILSGSYDNSLKLWDAQSGQCLRSTNGHSLPVTSAAFSPDGKFFLSGSYDRTLKLWDAQSGQCLRSFNGHSLPVTSAAFSPDGKFILSGSYDRTLKLWDAQSGQCLRSFNGHSHGVTSAAFSPDSKFILSGSDDQSLKLWDAQSGQCLRSFNGHSFPVTSVAFSPDGKFILSGSGDKSLKLWDAQSGQCLRSFNGHSHWVTSAAFSPDGQFIAGTDILENKSCWNLLGQLQEELPTEIDDWLPQGIPTLDKLQVEIIAKASLRITQNKKIIREILPLPNKQSLVREPWDEEEGLKPEHEIRWKLVSGPADAWRYCNAIDPETLEVHPPEYATEDGTWEIT